MLRSRGDKLREANKVLETNLHAAQAHSAEQYQQISKELDGLKASLTKSVHCGQSTQTLAKVRPKRRRIYADRHHVANERKITARKNKIELVVQEDLSSQSLSRRLRQLRQLRRH